MHVCSFQQKQLVCVRMDVYILEIRKASLNYNTQQGFPAAAARTETERDKTGERGSGAHASFE